MLSGWWLQSWTLPMQFTLRSWHPFRYEKQQQHVT